MAKIKNMGTATMKFGEGIIVSGSAGNDTHSLIVSGSTQLEGDINVRDVATYNTVEYFNSNTMKFNQYYLGNAAGSYFSVNEYQKVITIIPTGNSENYQVIGRITAQNAGETHTVYFNAALRSETLPDLSWTILYDEEYNGSRYIDPQLWVKETTTAGFIFAFKTLATIFGNVTVDIDVVPRTSSLKTNVTINNSVSSEQTTIDAGYTAYDMTKVFSKKSQDLTLEGSITATSFTGSISTSEVSNASGDLTLSSSPNSNDVYIKSSDKIYLDLDSDSDSTSYLEIRSNTDSIFVFSEAGKLRIGDNVPPTNALQVVHNGSDSSDGIMIVRNDTSVITDDLLGGIGFDNKDWGPPSSILEASAYIAAYAAEIHGSSNKGGYLTFGTSLIGDNWNTTSTEHMRIESEGIIQASGMPGYILAYRSWGNVNDENITITVGSPPGEQFIEGATNGKANITFTAPPTGNVELEFSVYINQVVAGANFIMSLSQNGVTYTRENGTYFRVFDGDETDSGVLITRWTLTGLTAGTSYQYWFGGYTTTTNGITLRWGNGGGGLIGYPPLIMKATTLPSSTS